MQTTGIFSIHEFTIPYTEYDETFYVIPFGDIHRSSHLCAVDKWLDFCAWAEKKERCYFLGMGDYDDLASSSERAILSDGRLHDTTRKSLEQLSKELTDKFADEVGFMKDRTIGLIEGNHYTSYLNGTTSTQRLAGHLNAKYLGVSTLTRLRFVHATRNTAMSLDIFAHHGLGGGTPSASVGRVDKMTANAEADIYLQGHDHKKWVDFDQKLVLAQGGGSLRLRDKKILKARTGSFLRGYVPGEASYVTDGCYRPADIGVVKIELTPKRDRRGGEDSCHIDLHASV
jgi:hypothetical protein